MGALLLATDTPSRILSEFASGPRNFATGFDSIHEHFGAGMSAEVMTSGVKKKGINVLN